MSSESGWRETNGKTARDIPTGWRKEWSSENVYGWVWHGKAGLKFSNLCVFSREPSAAERAEIEQRFIDSLMPEVPE